MMTMISIVIITVLKVIDKRGFKFLHRVLILCMYAHIHVRLTVRYQIFESNYLQPAGLTIADVTCLGPF